ncbi:hypothetical protein [Paenibacillus methanolicus]|uniref:Uncharacterized protein n=1 Tax=Paenibacillus methanolicus TaxID=582686 RepID=A0A5S5CG38_9BACL|nr:hypothetical protein [Paenibacillus methanolicus]TYP78119.1 hypothetical protein BCM02_102696 [Paenibacillus methanolicus]
MSPAKLLKWLTGAAELFLAIPILGGAIVIANGYIPLTIMFIAHAVTLLLSIKERSSKYGSVLGLLTSLLAWIPFLGWFMHAATGVLLVASAIRSDRPHSPQR